MIKNYSSRYNYKITMTDDIVKICNLRMWGFANGIKKTNHSLPDSFDIIDNIKNIDTLVLFDAISKPDDVINFSENLSVILTDLSLHEKRNVGSLIYNNKRIYIKIITDLNESTTTYLEQYVLNAFKLAEEKYGATIVLNTFYVSFYESGAGNYQHDYSFSTEKEAIEYFEEKFNHAIEGFKKEMEYFMEEKHYDRHDTHGFRQYCNVLTDENLLNFKERAMKAQKFLIPDISVEDSMKYMLYHSNAPIYFYHDNVKTPCLSDYLE